MDCPRHCDIRSTINIENVGQSFLFSGPAMLELGSRIVAVDPALTKQRIRVHGQAGTFEVGSSMYLLVTA
jgi:hypothetical protein